MGPVSISHGLWRCTRRKYLVSLSDMVRDYSESIDKQYRQWTEKDGVCKTAVQGRRRDTVTAGQGNRAAQKSSWSEREGDCSLTRGIEENGVVGAVHASGRRLPPPIICSGCDWLAEFPRVYNGPFSPTHVTAIGAKPHRDSLRHALALAA